MVGRPARQIAQVPYEGERYGTIGRGQACSAAPDEFGEFVNGELAQTRAPTLAGASRVPGIGNRLMSSTLVG
jgi:hypothetical protein